MSELALMQVVTLELILMLKSDNETTRNELKIRRKTISFDPII